MKPALVSLLLVVVCVYASVRRRSISQEKPKTVKELLAFYKDGEGRADPDCWLEYRQASKSICETRDPNRDTIGASCLWCENVPNTKARLVSYCMLRKGSVSTCDAGLMEFEKKFKEADANCVEQWERRVDSKCERPQAEESPYWVSKSSKFEELVGIIPSVGSGQPCEHGDIGTSTDAAAFAVWLKSQEPIRRNVQSTQNNKPGNGCPVNCATTTSVDHTCVCIADQAKLKIQRNTLITVYPVGEGDPCPSSLTEETITDDDQCVRTAEESTVRLVGERCDGSQGVATQITTTKYLVDGVPCGQDERTETVNTEKDCTPEPEPRDCAVTTESRTQTCDCQYDGASDIYKGVSVRWDQVVAVVPAVKHGKPCGKNDVVGNIRNKKTSDCSSECPVNCKVKVTELDKRCVCGDDAGTTAMLTTFQQSIVRKPKNGGRECPPEPEPELLQNPECAVVEKGDWQTECDCVGRKRWCSRWRWIKVTPQDSSEVCEEYQEKEERSHLPNFDWQCRPHMGYECDQSSCLCISYYTGTTTKATAYNISLAKFKELATHCKISAIDQCFKIPDGPHLRANPTAVYNFCADLEKLDPYRLTAERVLGLLLHHGHVPLKERPENIS